MGRFLLLSPLDRPPCQWIPHPLLTYL
jgi:hypothetical protein